MDRHTALMLPFFTEEYSIVTVCYTCCTLRIQIIRLHIQAPLDGHPSYCQHAILQPALVSRSLLTPRAGGTIVGWDGRRSSVVYGMCSLTTSSLLLQFHQTGNRVEISKNIIFLETDFHSCPIEVIGTKPSLSA